MPLPAISAGQGAVLGAGISALGSLFGSDGSESNMNKYAMTHGIRFRVKDAVKAGIHPLYALGATTPSPVQQIGGGDKRVERAAAAIGQGVQQYAQATDKDYQAAQINALNASATRDEAAAAESLSRIARTNQSANVSQDGALMTDLGDGPVNVRPVEQKTTQPGDMSTQAGKHAFFKRYNIGGVSVWGPASEEPAEAFENVGGIIVSIPKNVIELGKWAWKPYARLIARKLKEGKLKVKGKPNIKHKLPERWR